MSFDPSKPSLVPELVLKKKANLERLSLARNDRLQSQGNRKVFKKRNNVVKVRKPEAFVASKRGKLNNERRFKRVKKKGLQSRKRKEGQLGKRTVDEETGEELQQEQQQELWVETHPVWVETQRPKRKTKTLTYKSNSLHSNCVFAVRIRPDDSTTPSLVRRTLNKFRLRNLNDGAFIRFTPDTRRELEAVEQYVAYGTLGERSVSELLSRRGFVKVSQDGGKERVPLNNNVIVEDNLGEDTGCICVEDVAAELVNPTESFRKVNNFLWPFKLAGVDSGFEKRKLGFKSNGKEGYGDKGEGMEEWVKKVM
ncbi:hypothetical protein TrRE_jg1043 [Triparma retinervis]|uniref:Uncharacterized protein n=1 Tax=Triparma retinervis TaxID=2557542 RepID=A0A9W7FDH1_9STRA|nr:hypothetical protein TrRE_jg1043 [Triparma retinervis]